MVPIQTTALVLDAQHFGEADKRLTLLTRDVGKRMALAKGAARATSKFGARTLPLSWIDVLIAPGRSLDIMTQCETHDLFPDLRKKSEHLHWALRMAQFLSRSLPVGGSYPEIFHLFANFLVTLRSEKDPSVPAAAFMVKYLDLQGISPRLDQCSLCKRPLVRSPQKIFFGQSEGGILCRSCAQKQVSVTVLPFPCIQDMDRWKREDWKTLTHASLPEQLVQLVPTLEEYATQAMR